MSRARDLLEGIIGDTIKFGGKHSGAIAIGGTATAFGIQAALAQKQRNKKLRDAGYIGKVQKAKDDLTLARVKAAKTGYLSAKHRASISAAKANKKRVINKGLHTYATKIASEE